MMPSVVNASSPVIAGRHIIYFAIVSNVDNTVTSVVFPKLLFSKCPHFIIGIQV
jgi:hypothetical protein